MVPEMCFQIILLALNIVVMLMFMTKSLEDKSNVAAESALNIDDLQFPCVILTELNIYKLHHRVKTSHCGQSPNIDNLSQMTSFSDVLLPDFTLTLDITWSV